MSRAVRGLGSLALAGAGGVGLASGYEYGLWDLGAPGPGFFPIVAGGALLLLALATLAEREGPAEDGVFIRRLLGYVAGLVGFALAMEPLGALPAVAVLFVWLLGAVEGLSWRAVASTTVVATAGAWLLFDRLLNVPLPRGPFG